MGIPAECYQTPYPTTPSNSRCTGLRVGDRTRHSKARKGSYHCVARRGSDEPGPGHEHGQQRLGGDLGNRLIAEESGNEKGKTPEVDNRPKSSGGRIGRDCSLVKAPCKGQMYELLVHSFIKRIVVRIH